MFLFRVKGLRVPPFFVSYEQTVEGRVLVLTEVPLVTGEVKTPHNRSWYHR